MPPVGDGAALSPAELAASDPGGGNWPMWGGALARLTGRIEHVQAVIGQQEVASLVRVRHAAGLASAKIVKNATFKVYPGAPHGLTDTHKEQLNADPLAFLRA